MSLPTTIVTVISPSERKHQNPTHLDYNPMQESFLFNKCTALYIVSLFSNTQCSLQQFHFNNSHTIKHFIQRNVFALFDTGKETKFV